MKRGWKRSDNPAQVRQIYGRKGRGNEIASFKGSRCEDERDRGLYGTIEFRVENLRSAFDAEEAKQYE
jgi:hypothetical protein